MQQARLPCLSPTHVHRVCDAIQPSHPLSPVLNLSQHQGLFQWVSSLHQVAKVLELQLQHQSFQWIFSSGHKNGKGQFLLQSQRKAMPKNIPSSGHCYTNLTTFKFFFNYHFYWFFYVYLALYFPPQHCFVYPTSFCIHVFPLSQWDTYFNNFSVMICGENFTPLCENVFTFEWLFACAYSYQTLCNPMNCSSPGFSVHEIFQARILECVAVSSSRGSSQSRDQTCVSCKSPTMQVDFLLPRHQGSPPTIV